jgi:hypothetical protein
MKHSIPQNLLPIQAAAEIKARRLVAVSKAGAVYAQPESLVIGASTGFDVPADGTVTIAQNGYLLVEYASDATKGQPLTTAADGKVEVTTSDKAMFVSLTDTISGDIGSVVRVFAPVTPA